jgi:hypothetical protein
MAEPRTKDELLEIIRVERDNIDRVVAEAGIERLTEPGVEDDWSLRDVLAHLTGWRWYTVERIEAANRGDQPAPPWSAAVPSDDVDEINAWLQRQSQGQSVDEVLRDSHASFDRVAAAVSDATDDDLFTPGRFAWAGGDALGPRFVGGIGSHFHQEHEPAIRAWLARQSSRS